MAHSPQRLELLIVEDHPQMRRVLESEASRRGFRVHLASNGEEALQQLAKRPFHAMVTDLIMPKLNGLQLLWAIQHEPRWRRMPVVMLTGAAEPMLEREARAAGAMDFFTKPVDPDPFFRMLRELIRSPNRRAPLLVKPRWQRWQYWPICGEQPLALLSGVEPEVIIPHAPPPPMGEAASLIGTLEAGALGEWLAWNADVVRAVESPRRWRALAEDPDGKAQRSSAWPQRSYRPITRSAPRYSRGRTQ